MASLDSILNVVIPWTVGIIGVFLIYRPLKEPLAPLFSAIGRFFGAIRNRISGRNDDDIEVVHSLEYE